MDIGIDIANPLPIDNATKSHPTLIRIDIKIQFPLSQSPELALMGNEQICYLF